MVFQQLVQSQLFHLISMLICIGVVVWLFIRHYFRSGSDNENDRIKKLNTLYISGILTFIIIELITAICMNNTKQADIMSFVGFAATLSSLILSVLAIIVTLISGRRGDSQYEKIENVSDEVRTSLLTFTNKAASFDESIGRFQTVADDLSNQIREVYDKLNGMETPIIEIRDQLLASDGMAKDKKSKSGEIDDSFRTRVTSFIAHGSFSGDLALYACVLSKEYRLPFSMSQIREDDDDESYKFGYIIASIAIGVISATIKDKREIEVSNYYDGLKEMLETAIERFINTRPEDERATYSTRFNNIKQVFNR